MTNVILHLFASDIDNKCMRVNGKELYSGINKLSFNIQLPTTFTLTLTNKEPMDTIVDKNNNILKDKFIRVETLIVDNLRVSEYILPKLFNIITVDGQQVCSHYWGFNGIVTLDMNSNDSLEWHLKTQSLNY